MDPIRNERMDIVGYREEVPGGRVNIRDKHRELVGWIQIGHTRKADGTVASFQETEGLLYREFER